MINIVQAPRQSMAQFAPPPMEHDHLQADRAQAWREVQQAEAADPKVLRALRDQQQYLHSLGLLP